LGEAVRKGERRARAKDICERVTDETENTDETEELGKRGRRAKSEQSRVEG
jgi:hypothetical protein